MAGMEPPDSGNSFADILDIIRILRSPGGCPWDMKQTIETAVEDLLSEADEALPIQCSVSWQSSEQNPTQQIEHS